MEEVLYFVRWSRPASDDTEPATSLVSSGLDSLATMILPALCACSSLSTCFSLKTKLVSDLWSKVLRKQIASLSGYKVQGEPYFKTTIVVLL